MFCIITLDVIFVNVNLNELEQFYVRRKKSCSFILFSPYSLINIRLDALVRTSLRIYLCSEMNYWREYFCTEGLEVF